MFDVIIAGRGITAMSTALHLKRHGIKSVCMIGPQRDFTNCNSLSSSYISVSLHDNISRAVHGQGSQVAADLLRLNYHGFCDLLKESSLLGVTHCEGQVYRITSSSMEAREMLIASHWLSSRGFPAQYDHGLEQGKKFSTQSDGAASATINAAMLLDRLETDLKLTMFNENVTSLRCFPDHVLVQTSKGQNIQAQMIILACHLGLKTLLPDLQAVLINHADQWCTFAKEGDHPLLIPGNFILAEFGQFWISVGLNHTLTAGGGRFMRKWAGVEAAHAEFEPKINILVKEKIEDLFEIKLTATDKYQSQIELHTCDELPLIGPWYNESRILLASGFMGSGLSLGFAAGRGLADMVALGSSKTVPDTFHPKRLRSLPEVP